MSSQITACGQKQIWAFGPYWGSEMDRRVEEVFSAFPGSTIWVQIIPDVEARLVASMDEYAMLKIEIGVLAIN